MCEMQQIVWVKINIETIFQNLFCLRSTNLLFFFFANNLCYMQQPLFIIIYNYLHYSTQNTPILLCLEKRLTVLSGVLIENIGSFLKDIISTWQVKLRLTAKKNQWNLLWANQIRRQAESDFKASSSNKKRFLGYYVMKDLQGVWLQ